MISWLKYPENKPKQERRYHLCFKNDKYRNSERLIWDDGKWLTSDGYLVTNVSHFTEINPPQSDIVQPSTEGC